MQKGLFSGSSPFTQLIMLGFCMVTCFLLLMFAGILFVSLILGIPITELFNGVSNGEMEQNLNLMRYFQVLQGIRFKRFERILSRLQFVCNDINIATLPAVVHIIVHQYLIPCENHF